jgi:hypothetical protein
MGSMQSLETFKMTGDKPFSAHMGTQRLRRAVARKGVRALHIARQRLRHRIVLSEHHVWYALDPARTGLRDHGPRFRTPSGCGPPGPEPESVPDLIAHPYRWFPHVLPVWAPGLTRGLGLGPLGPPPSPASDPANIHHPRPDRSTTPRRTEQMQGATL